MSDTADTMQSRRALIDLFRELSAHALYPTESMIKWLRTCGVSADVDVRSGGLLVFDETIEQVDGDWGRGIYPPHVLDAALRHYGLSQRITTEMTGRGFAYSDLIDQLSTAWGHRE